MYLSAVNASAFCSLLTWYFYLHSILRSVMFSAAVNLTCVDGDYRGLLDIDGRNLSCSQIGLEVPHRCYETNIAAICCETCPRIRRTDVPGKHNSDCDHCCGSNHSDNLALAGWLVSSRLTSLSSTNTAISETNTRWLKTLQSTAVRVTVIIKQIRNQFLLVVKATGLLLLLLRPFYRLFFQDNLGKSAPERLTILDFTGARDDGVAVASAAPYAHHLHLAPKR